MKKTRKLTIENLKVKSFPTEQPDALKAKGGSGYTICFCTPYCVDTEYAVCG